MNKIVPQSTQRTIGGVTNIAGAAVGGLQRLQREVDHLNGMVAHVSASMRRYGADRHIWHEYQHLRDEARQLAWRLRRGEQYYDWSRLRAEITHTHQELHYLEEELHMPQSQWHRWSYC